MTFWENMEKEFNEMSGEIDDVNSDNIKLDTDFKDLFSDIKTDLKKIPKEDLWPSFSSESRYNEGKTEEEEESISNSVEANQPLQVGKSRKRRDKQCRIGGKSYEVGERWKDQDTGKDMICILMNIPKSLQPRLTESEVILSTDKTTAMAEGPEWKRPSVEPQWEYTAHPQKKERQEKPHKEEYQTDKQVDTHDKEQPEIVVDMTKSTGEKAEPVVEKLEPSDSQAEKVESSAETERGPTEATDETPESPVEVSAEAGEILKKSEVENVGNNETAGEEHETVDNESVSAKEHQEPQSVEGSVHEQNINKNITNNSVDTSDDESESEVKTAEAQSDSPKPKDEQSEKIVEHVSDTTQSDVEHNDEPTTDQAEHVIDTKTVLEQPDSTEVIQPIPPVTDENPDEIGSNVEGNPPKQQEGQPIYTKETVVKHRKIFRTEETIETTEKNRD